jgi:hypothetical protein
MQRPVILYAIVSLCALSVPAVPAQRGTSPRRPLV